MTARFDQALPARENYFSGHEARFSTNPLAIVGNGKWRLDFLTEASNRLRLPLLHPRILQVH